MDTKVGGRRVGVPDRRAEHMKRDSLKRIFSMMDSWNYSKPYQDNIRLAVTRAYDVGLERKQDLPDGK